MKLRNKKTGKILESYEIHFKNDENDYGFNSLAELNKEWEDYEEPKSFWTINTTFDCAEPIVSVIEISEMYDDKDAKSIGNYFETEEEAEKAVEKLKAWKRLKDKGFRFDNFVRDAIYFNLDEEQIQNKSILKDLDLLFGGEE